MADEIIDFVAAVRKDGYTNALLLGMGGSSLAAEVFSRSFGVKAGYLDLEVLDSTHPEAVLEHAKRLDPEKTLYIVSTKSGGTVETFSFMKFFYNQTLALIGKEKTGKHFIAITDPGSGLETAAKQLNFRKYFFKRSEHRRQVCGFVTLRNCSGGAARHRYQKTSEPGRVDGSQLQSRRHHCS